MFSWINHFFRKPKEAEQQEAQKSQAMQQQANTEPVESQPEEGLEEIIRLEAYYLWETDGKPEGKTDYYWQKASEIVRQSRVKVNR